MSDRIFGVFGLALGLFYLWAASIIPDMLQPGSLHNLTHDAIVKFVPPSE